MDVEPYPHFSTTMCESCDHTFNHNRYRSDSIISALRFNHFPEAHEAGKILEAIDVIDTEYERYDPEILRERCRSVLAPVRKLPPEILQAIFLLLRGSEPEVVVPDVAQVCSHWRTVALGTPELWSIVSAGRTRFSYSQRYHDLLALFLERSSIQPVSLTIRNPVDTRFVELVRRHSHRWRSLRLSSTNIRFYHELTQAFERSTFQMLERLVIVDATAELEPGQGVDPGDPGIALFRDAPKLHDVVLKNPLALWRLPWIQLTRLQYDADAAADGLRVVQLCPRLVECSLDKLRVPADVDLSPFYPSSKLRSLRLAVDTRRAQAGESIVHSFFACLTTPILISLEVVGQWSPVDFTKFLSRTQCQLENLTLGTGYMKDDKIILVLESLPLLKTLVLDADVGTSRQLQNRVITDKLLRRLTFFPDSDSLLPCLTHLALRTAVNFEDQVLVDVIESRWTPWVAELYGMPVSRLASFDLQLRGKKEHLAPFTVEQFRELFADGLRISLQQGTEKISLVSSDN
ncbi:hypothetical protein B0H10DRAFT_1983751 [Mycena sp. CBHHK59/15]|nr:hypothetical protein B0H10DRAFT_1983751 [Mycena sp. CBHHK59/15]